ncbi:hypothetical protein CARUB_v10012637mg [Capsella rubella]|uniref:FH2 domain-containing protein n=1 Tax=Capsella rubella TaxID=81985 RepID=R0IER8_9BRAS|nr:hypothetical protein CARUB_v10012637mg [Capsella rubella]
MLNKIMIPLPDLLNTVLALDVSAMDIDQVENLIKFCESKEEIEKLKNCAGGDREMLGKCEEVFAELMKVPRIEAKLRVLGFKIACVSKVEMSNSLILKSCSVVIDMNESAKLHQIMQTISTHENLASSVGSEVDSLVKVSDNMALMHELCKLVGESMPELLDFGNDLVHLEAASKIELKSVVEKMEAFVHVLNEVKEEYMASENDGAISMGFRYATYDFLHPLEYEAMWVDTLYEEATRIIDSYLAKFPARYTIEEVTKTVNNFMKTFIKCRRKKIERQAKGKKKITEKETMNIEQNKHL